ncbi:MAG: hypothetical protein AB7U95_22740 [Reyranella sp.]
MSKLTEERVALARRGENPFVISRLRSRWLVIGNVQPLPGYSLLFSPEQDGPFIARMRHYFAAR